MILGPRLVRRAAASRPFILYAIALAVVTIIWSVHTDSIFQHRLYYRYAQARMTAARWLRLNHKTDQQWLNAPASNFAPPGPLEGITANNATNKNPPAFPIASFGYHGALNASLDNDCLTYDARFASDEHAAIRRRVNATPSSQKGARTAVLLRAWDEFMWTDDDVRNVQAMISEMNALGNDYTVFILLHVKKNSHLVNGTAADIASLKQRYIPESFRSFTELWTYEECRMAYPATGEYEFYFHAYMAIQLFADRHPEFDYFWNWEMDARYTGLYSDFFPGVDSWAARQPEQDLWERNLRFYMPSVHGTYNQFAKATSSKQTPVGKPIPWIRPNSSLEPSQSPAEADFITLFPIFDTSYTLWPWKDYVVHYRLGEIVPRLAAMGTNARLSRRLLDLMAAENRAGRGMMTEMWPPTLAYHHNLKAVYVPHPIFLDREVPAETLAAIFNGGRNGGVGGSWKSVLHHEKAFLGSTWYWNAELPLQLYTRWMRGSSGTGDATEAKNEGDTFCLPPMLLHPIKGKDLYNATAKARASP